MKKVYLISILFVLIVSPLLAQVNIFPTDKPIVHPVWSRIADSNNLSRAVESAELSKDGMYAVSASKFGYNVRCWRVADGQMIWENKHDSEVECITFSPDNKKIASGGEDFVMKIWDAQNGQIIKELSHDAGLDGIAWSNNGKMIAGGGEDGDLYMWDADNYQLLFRLNVGSTINSIQFTKDDSHAVVAGNIQIPQPDGTRKYLGFAKLVDLKNKKVIREYKGHEASVKSIRLSSDEKYVATGAFDKTAKLYDFQSGKLLHTFKEDLRVEAVEISPNNAFLLVGSQSSGINFYKLSNFEKVYTLPCPRVEYLHFSKDGRLLLTSHEDSGLISLYLFESRGASEKVVNSQLNNKDLK